MAIISPELKRKYYPKVVGVGLNTLGLVAPGKAAEIALDIFCTPRRGRVQSYQRKFLKKFKQTKLEFNGHKIMTYDNQRSGKTVLLCHGWESNSFRWRKLYRVLQDLDLRVVMMDAPAHGGTEGDTFQALLYAQMIDVVAGHYKPECVLGHSVGGYSCIYYVSQYQPDFVDQLVIMASPDRLEDITQRYFGMIGLGKRVGKRYYGLIEKRFGNDITTYNAADFAADITSKGLIIHDKEDDVNLYYEAESIHSKWANSTLVSTTGFGHSLQDSSVYSAVAEALTAK